jgi:gamma-glutamylcyclotransferase (GGCT)/AIG2-like uncharacterized protein YtfP
MRKMTSRTACVYGTLKQGYHNNYLLQDGKFLKIDTIHGFRLRYSGNGSGFPVAERSEGDSILVEVYEVTDQIVDDLDWLEGYDEKNKDRSMYERIPVQTDSGIPGEMYLGGRMWHFREENNLVPKNEKGVYEWSR